VSERARTLGLGLMASLAASGVTLSAYYLALRDGTAPPVAPPLAETVLYIEPYKPHPVEKPHRWFTVPGSKEKICGIADFEDFSATIPCSKEDLKEDK
jgi:hypothetical protein